MDQPLPQTIRLADYTPYPWAIESVHLNFDLDPERTEVTSLLKVRRLQVGAAVLRLDGRELELVSVRVDGKSLAADDWQLAEDALSIGLLKDVASVEIVTRVAPVKNLSFMGLYCSNGNYFTQCEAEGFRKITYFPDRPDVMSQYTVTIRAPKAATPVLLANGNRISARDLPNGRHEAVWVDPFAKPSYLFALVAGTLECHEEIIKTRAGAKKRLQIYVEPKDAGKTAHAMESLKKSIRWDEDRYGLSLDLDQYMIVAVGDFNMGAMENKGLNVFNTKYVLANPASATDADYDGIESVIAHEYFHNWTGNRVTCRDWFQLSLKEGLTVFRDQEFSMDMARPTSGPGSALGAPTSARAVRRIGDVRVLRAAQFPEDAGPMAHPVRPDAYMEINNFYTVTIYEKGAEVVRMAQTIFGIAGFRRGMDLYFKRHDGQAVTCEDFFAAMADANPAALTPLERAQWFRWYAQAGTPRLKAEGEYNAREKTYTLKLAQWCPPSPNQPDKQAFVIPVTLGLLDAKGKALPLHLSGEANPRGLETTLLASGVTNMFVFTNLASRPVPSLLRGFSAPVMLEDDLSDADVAHLLAHDSDSFNRWEAGQRLFMGILKALAGKALVGGRLELPPSIIKVVKALLTDKKLDPAFKAEALMLPSETVIAEALELVDPQAIHSARVFMRQTLARACKNEFIRVARENEVKGAYSPDPISAGKRSLQGLAFAYLMELNDPALRAELLKRFGSAGNMSDRMNALGALMLSDSPERTRALDDFYKQFADDALVLDKWLALQASARGSNTLQQVKALMQHAAFSIKNPNKARALIGTFCHGNPAVFHAADGSGYAFWKTRVLEIDQFNPQVAARLARAVSSWKKLEPKRRAMLQSALEDIAAAPALSKDTREVVQKTLT